MLPWPWCLFTVPRHCVFRICSNIFYNAYLAVMNCFSLWLCSMSLLLYSLQKITFLVVAFWVVSFYFEGLTYVIISWILGFLYRGLMSSVVCAFVGELENFSYNFLFLFCFVLLLIYSASQRSFCMGIPFGSSKCLLCLVVYFFP